ncbi:hypothetical protein F53441_6748 [Fusarium austroafricanum]|uniref:Uncharacterized protein n=1 Tax=Fusarium austroafricanum TaxID=2364996 RepID=A0A8H4KIV1_9HYPO|nr:hypothetical protein F53441_6748 [Fusarium austroafricanum]
MPTATEYFGFSAHNLGPLTTTFTAPSACATATDHHVYVNKSSVPYMLGIPTCGIKDFGSCMPSGKSFDSLRKQTTSLNQGQYYYYSPGVVCPSSWSAVGALTKQGSDSVSASGVFTRPLFDDEDRITGAMQLQPEDFWSEVLDTSETLVYCCPSDYDVNAFGHCLSTLGPRSSYSYSSMCLTAGNASITEVTSLDGTSLTRPLLSFDPIGPATSTYLQERLLTRTGYSTDLVVGTWVPAVPLVHKKSDLDKTDDDDKDDGDDDSDDKDNETTDENSAYTATPRPGVVSMLGLTLGILLGMGTLL